MEKENNVVVKQIVIPEGCNRGSSTHPPFHNETTNNLRGRFPSPRRTGKLGNDALFLRQVSPDLQTFNAALYPGLQISGMTNAAKGLIPALVIPVLAVRAHAGYSAGGKSGFTLIELLVVVLIIGILAAVAVSQYQKAVWKSRAVQLLTMARSLATAQEAYYLANSTYADSFGELSLDFDNLTSITTPVISVATSSSDALKGNRWLELSVNNSQGSFSFSCAFFKDGPYKGAGFIYALKDPDDQLQQKLYCVERTDYINSPGDFCSKVYATTNLVKTKWSCRFYELP